MISSKNIVRKIDAHFLTIAAYFLLLKGPFKYQENSLDKKIFLKANLHSKEEKIAVMKSRKNVYFFEEKK